MTAKAQAELISCVNYSNRNLMPSGKDCVCFSLDEIQMVAKAMWEAGDAPLAWQHLTMEEKLEWENMATAAIEKTLIIIKNRNLDVQRD